MKNSVGEPMASIKESAEEESTSPHQIRNRDPNEMFKKMVLQDGQQNKRLGMNGRSKAKANRSAGSMRHPTRIRFLVCTLGLMSLAMCQMSRMVLNLTLPLMVDPRVLKSGSQSTIDPTVVHDGSCPAADDPQNPLIDHISTSINQSSTNDLEGELQTTTTTLGNYLFPVETLDENTIEPETSTISPDEIPSDESTSDEPEERFMWSIEQQSVLLGGFYYSYFVFMILGGRISEMYGAKYVLFTAVAGSAIINLATPFLARYSFPLTVVSRIALGAIQAGVFPGMYALIAKWLTLTEASIFAPLIKVSLRLGMLLGSAVPGLMCHWSEVYYCTGILCVTWSIAWLLIATSDPSDNTWVSEAELQRINRKKAKPNTTLSVEMTQPNRSNEQVAPKVAPRSTPWLRIVTHPSVIGLIIVKFTFNYGVDFLAILLPSYLKFVHQASKETISTITTIMYGLQVCLVAGVGWLCKTMIQKRPFGLSKTAIRKIFQGLASFGMGFLYILITFNNCNLLYLAVMLQVLSLFSMFTAGGETMLPYDLSNEYPATIMAIANSIANTSGITTTTLAGLILGKHSSSYDRWNILLYLIAGVNIAGGVAFSCLIKAENIDFHAPRKPKDKSKDGMFEVDLESSTDNHVTTRELPSLQPPSEIVKPVEPESRSIDESAGSDSAAKEQKSTVEENAPEDHPDISEKETDATDQTTSELAVDKSNETESDSPNEKGTPNSAIQ